MGWQSLVADVGLELDRETGLPAYREVIVTVPRQDGKTTLLLAIKIDRCLLWDKPQRVAYSAQTGWDARRKLLDDEVPLLERSPFWGAVQKVNRAQGSEGLLWWNGSRVDLMASTAGAGHGRTIHLGIIDEAFDDTDDRREQAILPAQATVDDAQLWVASTAGTDQSVYLNRKLEAGRHAAASGATSGIAYFEWSAPVDADIDDPRVWRGAIPALGITISEEAVAHARKTMSESEFCRAFLNIPTSTATDRVIPAALWAEACRQRVKPEGSLRFGVDAMPDRSRAAIAAFGDGVGELVEARDGVSWVAGRVVALARKWKGPVVIDGGGPAASVAAEIEAAGVIVERLPGPDVAAACGRIYDAIADGAIKVRTSPILNDAVAAVRKRPVGDRFVWSRSASEGDVSPFYALTLAFGPGEPQSLVPLVATV